MAIYDVKIELGSVEFEDIEADSPEEAEGQAWLDLWKGDWLSQLTDDAKVTVREIWLRESL